MLQKKFIMQDIKALLTKKNFLILASIGAVAIIPWSYWFSGFFLISTIFFALLNYPQFSWKDAEFNSKLIVVLCALYFLLHVFSLLYTHDLKLGVFLLEKKYTFAIIPLSILVATSIGLTRQIVLRFFSYSIFVATIVCLLIAVYNNYAYNVEHSVPLSSFNNWFYSYVLLSQNIGLHPAYFAAYISLVILYLISTMAAPLDRKTFIVSSFLILYFLFFIVLLSSRNILVSTVVVLMGISVVYAIKHKSLKLFFSGLLCLAIVVLVVVSNDITRSRISEMWDVGNKSVGQWGGISLRMQEWTASAELIKENILFGTGPGDFMSELMSKYQQRGHGSLADANFNSHNQFIQTTASLGVVGLIVLLAIFVISFKKALNKRDVLYTCFLLIFGVFSITESTLEVQKGIVFFVLVNSILFFSKK